MSKEKVYIVVSHKHNLKKGTKDQWEVAESVEFVNQLRNRHYTTSSAIGDYINRKMEKGERHGMGDYSKFEEYVRAKYTKEMAQLDAAYRADQVVVKEVVSPELIADEFGNLRAKTVFDKEPV
jgi:hypothetical protein